ncbi:MAG: EamA family transporter, partial [Desulfurococcales archaeon]|nr:EamA family transporter [Desulfurococcales archaeon]
MSAEVGLLLAGISGFAFSLGDVSVRAASTKLTPRANLLISLLIGTPFGALVASLSGQTFPSTPNLLMLYGLAGLLNFVAGRSLFYLSIAWAGASTSSVVTSLAVPLGAFFAWVVIGETPGVG